MDESLKSLQLSHRLLMTLCLAISILLLSSVHNVSPYEAALEELRKIEPTLDESGKLTTEAMQKDYAPLLDSVRRILPNIDSNKIEIESTISTNDEIPFIRPMFAANQAHPIDSYYNYLSIAPKFDGYWVYKPAPSKFSEIVSSLASQNGLKQISSLSLSDLADPSKGYTAIQGKCSLGMAPQKGEGARLYTYGFSKGETDLDCARERKQLPDSVISLFLTRGLIERSGDTYLALPKLRAVWDQVKGQDITILVDILGRKVAEEKAKDAQALDFLGLKISTNLVFWLGPILICALLAYLGVLVGHIQRVADMDREAVQTFPWAGFMVSWRGRAFLITTVLVLPTSAGIALIWLSAAPNWKTVVAACLFASITIFLAGVVLAGTRKLARRTNLLGDEIQPTPP